VGGQERFSDNPLAVFLRAAAVTTAGVGASFLMGKMVVIAMAGFYPSKTLLGTVAAPTKRKVYFAFRFKDIMRVNNVRQSGRIGQDEEKNPREFYDRSIWEQRSISDPESLKRLMREGVEHSSVVCVLAGSDTWKSRWVKYEIARAVVDGKGLLTVHINGLAHVQTRMPEPAGFNPLDIMGVYQANGRFYLAEKKWVPVTAGSQQYEWRWFRYDDYTDPVTCPRYLGVKTLSHVSLLSEGTRVYEYVRESGVQKLGLWVDAAAQQVGR
jgi:hypothetical protein